MKILCFCLFFVLIISCSKSGNDPQPTPAETSCVLFSDSTQYISEFRKNLYERDSKGRISKQIQYNAKGEVFTLDCEYNTKGEVSKLKQIWKQDFYALYTTEALYDVNGNISGYNQYGSSPYGSDTAHFYIRPVDNKFFLFQILAGNPDTSLIYVSYYENGNNTQIDHYHNDTIEYTEKFEYNNIENKDRFRQIVKSIKLYPFPSKNMLSRYTRTSMSPNIPAADFVYNYELNSKGDPAKITSTDIITNVAESTSYTYLCK